MHLLALATTALLAAAVSANKASQASNFDISPSVAERYGCNSVCQADLKEHNTADLAIFDTPFDFDFYATASNFSFSSPGDLLKLKALNGTALNIPAGVSVYKIQYTSQDVGGTIVPATAFLAVPFARRNNPYRLVAYAHGTTGVFRGCAPSSSSYLFDYDSWSPLLLAGYAVVATDYAGLGNNMTAHKYISSAANANDVYWSVTAAQNAFPSAFTPEWVSIGHSQGGGAVYKLSEHKLVQGRRSAYLGGVSIAPITKIYDSLLQALTTLGDGASGGYESYKVFGVLPSLVLGVQALFPNYTAPFLAEPMRQRLELAKIGQYCDVAISGLVADLSINELIGNITATDVAVLQRFQELNAPAQGDSASKPLLLIQGEEDTIVFESMVESAYRDSCDAGNVVHLSLYPGLDHSATVGASAPEWLAFIEGLFEGTATLTKCVNKTVNAFDLEHAAAPVDDV
ncbi:Alpha/Beta hydrolase protein [Aspergillus venezuelensis]